MLTPKSKQMDLFNMKTDPKDLQNSLWEAANTLRGSAVDRTDWKGYILPLLFFKRISIVENVVNDIDHIVRDVRFDGWQKTNAGEREIKKALRKTLFKYKLHQEQELFSKAYQYIEQHY